jgi:hypothetical protein
MLVSPYWQEDALPAEMPLPKSPGRSSEVQGAGFKVYVKNILMINLGFWTLNLNRTLPKTKLLFLSIGYHS